MKSFPPGLQEHLDSGTTTMVNCWRVERKDGLIQGFTEHDEDLFFDGVFYLASSGFTSTRVDSSLGLSVDNLNADGVLSSEAISAEELAAGFYDDAEVQLWWVNFNDVSQRVLFNSGNIGKVKRSETSFSAELRSKSSRLQQRTGRVYQRTCDAVLGDSRCKADLSSKISNGTVTLSPSRRELEISGVSNDVQGFYSFGVIRFTSGKNEGRRMEIKSHSPGKVFLWQPLPFEISIGDTFEITVGCDKYVGTCAEKFDNVKNFQGFPRVPGTDVVSNYVDRDSKQRGGSLFE